MLLPEFSLKRNGKSAKLNAPDRIKFKWAPKGCYHLEPMIAAIPNHLN